MGRGAVIGPTCGRCGYIHTRPYKVGRFTQIVPLWQGYWGGPLRDTRQAAERDLCDRNYGTKEG